MKASVCLATVLMGALTWTVAAAENESVHFLPVAEKSQATRANYERTIGVCHPIENELDSRLSAVNSVSPVIAAMSYIEKFEHKKFSDADYLSLYNAAKMTLLQTPTHGELGLDEKNLSGRYFSADYSYTGPDRATVLVEFGAYKVKVKYYFELMHGVPDSSEEGSATDDKSICPNGRVWKISFNPDDPMINKQWGQTRFIAKTLPSPQPSGETPSHSTRRQSRQVAGYPASRRGGNRERQS